MIAITLGSDGEEQDEMQGHTNKNTTRANIILNGDTCYTQLQSIVMSGIDMEKRLSELLQSLQLDSSYLNIWLVDFGEIIRANGGEISK